MSPPAGSPPASGSSTGRSEPLGRWFAKNGWLMTSVWLVFLAFPALSILGMDDIGTVAKVVSMVLLVAFGVVYSHGFRRRDQVAQRLAQGSQPAGVGQPSGWIHTSALVLITIGLYALAELPVLGIIPFVVVFAVFFLPWPGVFVVSAAGLAATIVAPWAAGLLDELWFLSLTVLGAAGATVLVRVVEGNRLEQTRLRADLAISDERSRVARDVHDVLGHSLTAVILKVELAQRMLEGVQVDEADGQDRIAACRQQLGELEGISRDALAEIRATVGGLRAADLADEIAAARTVLADAGVELLVTGEVVAVPERRRPVLAWVVREAVTNVVRHADAGRCHIELAPGPGPVLLRVYDDGVGMGDRTEGNGLRGLQERVASTGARLRIDQARSEGGVVELDDRSGPGTMIEVAV